MDPAYDGTRKFCSLGYAVRTLENQVYAMEYRGIFGAPQYRPNLALFGVPTGALALPLLNWVLGTEALGPPHALEILSPPPPPELPTLPERLGHLTHPVENSPCVSWKFAADFFQRWNVIPTSLAEIEENEERYQKLRAEFIARREAIELRIRQELSDRRELSAAYKAGNKDAVRKLVLTNLTRHSLPPELNLGSDFSLDTVSRVALVTIGSPNTASLRWVKHGPTRKNKWQPVSEAAKKRASQALLRALCIRAAYLTAMSDPGDFFDTVAVNAHQKWFDPATGEPREGIVASLQAEKEELRRLQPGHLDPDACFRHLGGIATPNILNAAPIRPIFVMNTDDKRIVANRDISGQLSEEANLAAMPWEDFEHLVRQLFEWMFASDGVEVKVTRASRDRGVDAIVFDPDPIRGGKYVIQAKRYTRTVDVAAVRDLYGTVMNEGANRGILVTTSAYGPDAYDFAKDKPISLIDGPNLIMLLRKNGRNYRIDLEEARRVAGSM